VSDHVAVTPSPDAVRAQLDRILTSEPFANAGRLARFLRYIVERTLAGEADQLKEYVLGVDVFDRGDAYDPRIDSIVRVDARRLRAKLEEYYTGPGAKDPLLITMPRGSYVPVIEAQTAATHSARGVVLMGVLAVVVLVVVASVAWRSRAAPSGTVIAVLPFEQHSGTPEDERLASRMTDAITAELARLGTLEVVSRTSARQFEGSRPAMREIAKRLGATVIMEGTVESEGDRIKVQPRLVNATADRKMWVDTFEAPRAEVGTLPARIAAAAANALTQRPQ
jgi:TolB-like protein